MIIAAAIKFYIIPAEREVILYGLRHDSPYKQLETLGFKNDEYKELEQGFLTSEGDFLNRREAYYYAVKCGQIEKTDNPDDYEYDCLISEMLW